MPGIDPASFRTSALRKTQPVASPYTYSKLLPVSCAPIGKLTSLFSVGLYTCVIWSALNGKTIS